MEIDWHGVAIALFVTFISLFVFTRISDISGFCIDHVEFSTSHCISTSGELIALAPLALLISSVRALLIPVVCFSLGILYYYKGHHVERWTDVVMPGFVIGFIGGFITLIGLTYFQSPILLDMVFFYTMLSWFGFFIGMVVMCSIIGGLIFYATVTHSQGARKPKYSDRGGAHPKH